MTVEWTNLIKLESSEVSKIDEVSGIYRLSYLNPSDQKYYVYYVGQSDDLNDRLNDHLLENEEDRCCQKFLKNHSCFFRAAAVPNQEDRDGIEAFLFDHFKPKCSERKPDVEPIEVNINN